MNQKIEEKQNDTVSVRLDEEHSKKLHYICTVKGKRKSTIIRELIKNGKILLVNEKEIARQVAHAENNFNNNVLQVNDCLERAKESADSLRHSIKEHSDAMDNSTEKNLSHAVSEMERVVDESKEVFRLLKNSSEKELKKIVDPYCGK